MSHEVLEFLLGFVERRGDVNDAKKAREYREALVADPAPEKAEVSGDAS